MCFLPVHTIAQYVFHQSTVTLAFLLGNIAYKEILTSQPQFFDRSVVLYMVVSQNGHESSQEHFLQKSTSFTIAQERDSLVTQKRSL